MLKRSQQRKSTFREFLAFFGGSAVGLAIDLVGFQVLVLLGLPPWQANAISSALSITAVYVVVTRYSFGVAPRLSTYFLFFAWYGLSIVAFSGLIQLAVSLTEWYPLVWKLISVPCSFTLNYIFSTFLLRSRLKSPRPDQSSQALNVE